MCVAIPRRHRGTAVPTAHGQSVSSTSACADCAMDVRNQSSALIVRMHASIHHLLRRHHGIITRRQALAVGLSASELARLDRTGTLIRVHAGVFRHAATPTTWEQRLTAGLLAAGPTAAISHRSGAAIWGVANLSVSMIELTKPGPAPVRRSGLHVHRNRLESADVTTRGGLTVTTPARTIIDLAPSCRHCWYVGRWKPGSRRRS